MPAASTIKVALMIGISDNTATNMIIDVLGLTHASERIRALGASHTWLERRLMDAAAVERGQRNETTADDQTLILDRLAGPELLPTPLRELGLAMLGRQHLNDRMPAALGPDVRCLHKTGEITGVRHDAVIMKDVSHDRCMSLHDHGSVGEGSEP